MQDFYPKKRITIFVALLISTFLAGTYFIHLRTSPEVPFPGIGSKAQNLLLPDLKGGNDVSLNEYKGKKLVLLNFWASWCPSCPREITEMVKIQKEFSDRLVVLGVNRAEPKSVAEKFAQTTAAYGTYPLLLDANDTVFKLYKGFAMPTSILIDKKGIIRRINNGPMTADEIRSLMADTAE